MFSVSVSVVFISPCSIMSQDTKKMTKELSYLALGDSYTLNQYRGRDIAEFGKEFDELLMKAVDLAGGDPDKVFVLSIPHWGLTEFAGGKDRAKIVSEIELFNKVVKEDAFFRTVDFIDISEISKKAENDPSLLAKDGLHYSGKMHRLWVDRIIRSKFK